MAIDSCLPNNEQDCDERDWAEPNKQVQSPPPICFSALAISHRRFQGLIAHTAAEEPQVHFSPGRTVRENIIVGLSPSITENN
jgi:hypothetical protein